MVIHRWKTASTTTSQDQFCYLGQIRQFGLELIACDAFSSAFSKVSTMSFANRFESLRSSAFSGVLVWTIGESTSKSIRFQTKTDYMDGAWENFIQLQNHFFFFSKFKCGRLVFTEYDVSLATNISQSSFKNNGIFPFAMKKIHPSYSNFYVLVHLRAASNRLS